MNLNSVAELIEKKKVLDIEVANVVAGLTDKSISLDVRWSLFGMLESAGLLKTESWGNGNIDILHHKLDLYDNFNMDRHEKMDFLDMYSDQIKDHLMDEFEISQEKADAWREKVLEKGYGSFVWDW